MKRATVVLAALALMVGGVGQARADMILYNSLSAPSNALSPVVRGPLADSFSTGGTAGNLSDVKLGLALIASPPTGSISVQLLSDASTSPGTVLTTIGTVNDSALSNYTVVDLPTSYPLAANTRYWVQLSTSDSSAYWTHSQDASGVGVANEYFASQSSVTPNSTSPYPYQMEVIEGSANAVPEPSTLTLLGLGSLGLLGYGWRRRKRTIA